MFCSRCGSEITGKSKFCPSCGLDLMATTPVHAIATGALQETDLVREALTAEYEIIEELGRGGMALVYRARDRQLEREVAIKVLPFSLAFDAEFVERFQREARTAAQLEHPNIIPIYRVGRSGRVIYFVMKFLRGGSLSTVLSERRRLSPPEIRRLLTEAGSALGYAAQRGIVHRDIKPDNIMFDEFGQCVLTDFGIAKAASGQRLTGTGMSIGTPHYMSPEQARAQAIDGRSDIYSLGVVAYQALTGTVPYDGDDSFSIGYKHITEPVPVPQLITADERRLFEVIKRMLMKDPADRFQSCEELVASLQGQPIAAAGSVRASVATAGVGGGCGSDAPEPDLGRSAADREPADHADRVASGEPPDDAARAARHPAPRGRPLGGHAARRRIVGIGLALARARDRSAGWAALPTTTSRRGFAPCSEAVGDSMAVPGLPIHPDSAPAAAPPSAGPDSVAAQPLPAAADSAPSARPVRPPPTSRPTAPAAASGDSGGVRLVGLPRGSTVMIDERPVLDPVSQLSAGKHVLAVSAPRFQFFTDTITVRAGDTLELTPALLPVGAPAQTASKPPAETTPAQPVDRCSPGRGYNAATCFDERPKPVEAPFVPAAGGARGDATAVAALGEGVGRGAHGGHQESPPVR